MLDDASPQTHCNKKPKHFKFREHLPKSTVSKLLRRVLLERHNGG